MKKFRKAAAYALSLLLAAQVFGAGMLVSAAPADNDATNANADALEQVLSSDVSYINFYSEHKDSKKHYGFLSTAVAATEKTTAATTVDGTAGYALDEEKNSWVDFKVTVTETALYGIKVKYYTPVSVSGRDIVLSLTVDGKTPYEKAKTLALTRVWKDSGKIKQDANGNDLRPTQEEVPIWQEAMFINEQALYDEPYMLYLEAGEHTVRIKIEEESAIIAELSLGLEEKAMSYEEYIGQFGDSDYADGEAIIKQAEDAYRKSDSMLYSTYDRTTTDVTPYDPAAMKLNTIGQSNWGQNGQWISWEAPIEKAGLYKIAFHANQDFSQSINSYRKLLVNGELPFAEADNISFKYDTSWYMKTLGDKEPMYVYLKPGDVISLSCVPGELAGVLRNVQQTVLNLNAIYRDIIAITSTSPDIYQDYNLHKKIPGLEDSLKANQKVLEETYDEVRRVLGGSGGNASTIIQVAEMLGDLAYDPYTIPDRLSNFKSEIDNLASLILTLQSQPLELDFIAFVPKDAKTPSGKGGFFEGLKYSFLKFCYSFVTDYNSFQGDGENSKQINVWVSTGRDQMQILNNMISDSFTVDTGINVRLSLINTGMTMIQATLAGKGPDVALMVSKDLPVNLAMRGALLDLTDYDFNQLRSETSESAWTSFYYNGGLYGIPEGETFQMLFYRTDIFEELGLGGPPDTWDEFYDYMEIIQKNNFSVGINEVDGTNYGVSAGIDIFSMFLYQRGGRFYNEKLDATLFDTEVAYQAFKQWVNLYDTYGLDRSFSFYNVFRSGEMPMALQGYGAYNQLMAAAPEITGLWKFAPIPGTPKADGTIDRSQNTGVTASVILKAAEDHNVADECVEFVRWWTSADIQTRYCKELEAILGVAARGNPANHVALRNLGWTKEELAVLEESYKWTVNMEQIPGNYLVSRSLTSAARAAMSKKQTIRRALLLYNIDINEEIARKRAEFGLD